MVRKSGTIKLVSPNGKVLQQGLYKGAAHRERFVNDWIKLYGEGMKRYFIQIAPETDEDILLKKRPEAIVPRDWVRPAAKYDNDNRSLYI